MLKKSFKRENGMWMTVYLKEDLPFSAAIIIVTLYVIEKLNC